MELIIREKQQQHGIEKQENLLQMQLYGSVAEQRISVRELVRMMFLVKKFTDGLV